MPVGLPIWRSSLSASGSLILPKYHPGGSSSYRKERKRIFPTNQASSTLCVVYEIFVHLYVCTGQCSICIGLGWISRFPYRSVCTLTMNFKIWSRVSFVHIQHIHSYSFFSTIHTFTTVLHNTVEGQLTWGFWGGDCTAATLSSPEVVWACT